MITTTRIISILMVIAAALTVSATAWSQQGTSVYEGNWPSWAADAAANRYSPLDQFNADNVGDL